MHLKEVHMENFKSFGRKLTVPFEPGFTAITGPNGSGKSNIGDAVLFVLGPNSPRAIRAGRLTDLIFNGGATGKAASYCLVSLTFDNRDRTMPVDADDVVLTRKVKRAPKKDDKDAYNSYFYVNGRASQKREFVDLLQHARISADGYNITQQGDVLQVCTMSNVQRRQVLDGIAGVTSFDGDIDKANKRRTEVEENLERIGIVLEEIERDLAQLEKDKEAAQKYQELQQEIAQTKGRMAWRRKADLERQIAQVQQQIEEFGKQRTELEAKRNELLGKQKELQSQFAEAEQRIREEGGEEVQELQDQLEAARDRMVRLEEKINFVKSELADGKEDLLPMQEELRRVRKEHERTSKLHADQDEAFTAADGQLAERKKELEALRARMSQSNESLMLLNRDLAKLKHEHEAKQLELHEVRLEADRLEDRAQSAAKQAQQAAEEAQATETDLKETTWEANELRKDSEGAGKKAKELERRMFDLRKAQAELTKQNEDLENRIRRLQRERAELQAQQDAAARAAGGAPRAVDEILKARDQGQIQGIIGTIAELASVEDRYQTALQTAAGANMNAIVVEDDAVAAKCIELLKSARAGRAKLFPLNKMVPGRPRGQALMKVKQDGCLGFALDLVDYNPRYQNAFWNAFGDTLVVDTMNTGRRLMGGVRMVSLDGELFEASGAMVGGSRGKKGDGPSFGNADRGRLDELINKVAEAEDLQEQTINRLAKVREEIDAMREQLDAEGRSGAGGADRLKELEKKEDRLKGIFESQTKDAARLGEEAQKFQADAAKAQERIDALETRLAELDALREEKGQLMMKGSKKEWRERAEELEKEISELREAALQAENRRDVASKQLELVADRVKEIEKQIADVDGAEERLKTTLKDHQEDHGKAKAEVDALMKLEREATKALKGLREERDKLYEALTDLKAKIDKVADRMETHYGLVTNAKAKLPALEEALGDAKVELQENPVEIADDEDVAPYDDLRKHLRNLEARLDRLGPVNMRALEQYEAQAERQRTLKEEVDRLEDQRTELVKLVEEITQKKKDALLVVFNAINENFAQVYQRLSNGGKALMELENPDDPFQGGLVLKAQPPGKRVLRLDALSGGEKSLTSMAFIFALQMYDPSPFYYLDEVDQNLDAVNSELLAKLVKDNAAYAQFIVVSLRKVTLKESSHIYGVTQQTPGLSEVIANFDLQNVPDEDKSKGGVRPGDAPDAPASPEGADERDEGNDKESLQQTFQEMVQVEVKP